MQVPSSPSRQSKIQFVADADHAPRKPARTTDSLPRSRRVSAPVYMTSLRKSHPFAPPGSTSESDPTLAVFSEEYDLYPRILQDVQRALKLKAKREASLKQKNRLSTSMVDPFLRSASLSSTHPLHSAPPFPSVNVDLASSSDIDFGPSVGNNNVIVEGHPVPSSSDNGITLDWSGIASDGEKRWPLPIKRKGKAPIPHLNVLVQQQENLYSERLGNIQKQVSTSTMHKASITKDQLTRRYSLLNTLTPLHPTPLRLIDVARWHKSQEPDFQTALEQAEPTTWLKHLQKNRKTTVRSPWQLTARVTEEYVHALDGRIATASATNEDIQVYTPSRASLSPTGTNLFPVTSHGSSHVSFDPSLSRRLSFEGRISFEPLTRSTRDSLDVFSHLSVESSYSSAGSRSPKRRDMALPNGKRWPDDLSTRLQRRLTRESEGVTSTKNSLSEVSELNVAGGNPFQFDKRTTEPETFVTPGSDLQVAFQRSEGNGITLPNIMEVNGGSQLESVGAITSAQSDRLAPWIENKRRKRINQEKLRREYESKSQLLGEATAQNYRIRQMLNRVSIVVKEYETAQGNALAPFDNRHQLQRLPRELLDAFNHDPAAVTGPTRRLRGYKAVDDIHSRLVKQRAIFRQFLSDHAHRPTVDMGSLLHDPTAALHTSLESLQQYNKEIQSRAREVGQLLKKVQDIQTRVKANYNDVLSHTSVVYPELSVIVALEESYKDQYQQFWEIGMDALTFILDNVTPLWRTYGKTIGEDIRDFLIIPLYRNEFTGEPKSYPIMYVPRRSLRHWLGLGLLYLSTIAITFLSTRIAIALVTHAGLRYIPYESIRWTALPLFWIMIVIQWMIVLTAFTILFLEFAVLFWWAGWLIKVFA